MDLTYLPKVDTSFSSNTQNLSTNVDLLLTAWRRIQGPHCTSQYLFPPWSGQAVVSVRLHGEDSKLHSHEYVRWEPEQD